MFGAVYFGNAYFGGYPSSLTIALVNLFLSLEFEKADIIAFYEVAALTLELK